MKEFKTNRKYRIKEIVCRNGDKFYMPQRSLFGMFWFSWLGIGMVPEYYDRKMFPSADMARHFIEEQVQDKREVWDHKIVKERKIDY